jgi:hypothetical protein
LVLKLHSMSEHIMFNRIFFALLYLPYPLLVPHTSTQTGWHKVQPKSTDLGRL